MWESWSVHLLHGRSASVVAQGGALGGAAGSVMVLEFFFFFCKTSPKSLLESPQEASPSYRVSPSSQVTVSGWGSREEKGAADSGSAFVHNN